MAKLISKTYGNALFELAVEEDKVDSLMEEIQVLRKILLDETEWNKLMHHPKIVKEEKIKMLETVFQASIQKELMGFLSLVVIKDRYSDIDAILAYFLDRVKELKGIGVAYITTASDLQPDQEKQIEEKLLVTTKYNKMEMHYSVDKKLIGGMVIQIGDRVVDSSVSTKLSELQRQLMKIQLK